MHFSFIYLVQLSDKASSENCEEQAGEQLQEEAVEPHVQGKQGLINDLKMDIVGVDCG